MNRLGKRRKRWEKLGRCMIWILMLTGLFLNLTLGAGCGWDEEASTSSTGDAKDSKDKAAREVVLMTHDSFAVSEGVLASFQEQTGLELRILKSGDAGAMLNQAILTKDNPLADVVFGVDNISQGIILGQYGLVQHGSCVPGFEYA